jgi:hypothetical protein
MAGTTIEERLSAVEQDLAQIKQRLNVGQLQPPAHPWDKVFGAFSNSEGFEEAVRLGREYRESLRPKEGEDCP